MLELLCVCYFVACSDGFDLFSHREVRRETFFHVLEEVAHGIEQELESKEKKKRKRRWCK